MLNWIEQERTLTNAALTVRVQARATDDQGIILSPAFFPRAEARSVRLADITTLDARPVADRREWNAPGRKIALEVPSFREMEMLPVESYFDMYEQEMQKLIEGTNGNEAVLRQIVGPDIPKRTDGLATANVRRVDLDAFRAWALGSVTVRDPQGATPDRVVSFQFSTDRYVTPTAWTGTPSTGTAWTQFMAETKNARRLIGPLRGAVMRDSTYTALQYTAPLATGQTYPLSRTQLEEIISREYPGPFAIIVFEDTVQEYTDGGLSKTSVNIWPANRVAWIPADGIVGSTYYAPSVTGFQLAGANPGFQIDVRGQVVVRTVVNEGKGLIVRCQVNALAVPNEQKVYVVNAGI
jgi:hypothetical protein